jgi:WD40 repeat protein
LIVLYGHNKDARCVAYSPDGQLLASGGVDGTVRRWNIATGESTILFRSKPRRAVLALEFTQDGKTLAWGCGDTVYLWDTAAQNLRTTLPGHQGSINALSFSPDSRCLAVATKVFGIAAHEGHASWWDTQTGASRDEIRKRIPPDYGNWLDRAAWAIVFSPTGDTIALCLANIGIIVMSWPICEQRVVFKSGAHSVSYRPDGTMLATRTDANVISLLQLREPKSRIVLKGHTKWVKAVTFSPDGRLLGSGSSDGTVRLWDVASRAERSCFDWKVGAVSGIAFAPDGMTAAVAGEKAVVVFDVESV